MHPLKEHLIQYYEQLDADLHFAFMETQQHLTKGNLHQFRVIMKRIKAFLRFLQQIDPHFPVKGCMEDLRPLFKEAGRLRNYQIEYKLLAEEEKRLDLPATSSAEVSREIQRQKDAFGEFEQEFSLAPIREIQSMVISHIRHLTEETLPNRINGYFHQRLGAISYMAEKGQEDKDYLHDLRTRIKEVFYNLQLLDAITPDYHLSLDLLTPLENLQHQLGIWHDHLITRKEVKHLPPPPKRLKTQLRRMKNSISC